MPAFTAVRRARLAIDALAIAIEFIALALGATLAARTHKLASTRGTGGATACVGILYAFPRTGIDMETVDTLQNFALALRTGTTLPSCDGVRT